MTNETAQMLHDRIDHDFAFHPADSDEKRNAHGSIREECRSLAHVLVRRVGPCRELSIALTHLEEVMHWANAGYAKQNSVSD